MIDVLNSRAGQIVAGACSFGLLTIGCVIWLNYGGYLGGLVVVNLTIACGAFWLWVGVQIKRGYHAPVVVYEKPEKLARVVDGQVMPQPLYPASLTSLTTHYDPRITAPAPALVAPIPEASPMLPRAEPFYRIVRDLTPERLVLGYNGDGKILGRIDDLLSTAIIGRPGTGKTTALRFVCASVLRIGGDVAIMDPHGSLGDDVAGVMRDYASDAADMHRLAAYLDEQLGLRLAHRLTRQFAPLLLIADEWPVISHLSAVAVEIAGKIVLEGRKVGMFALISGQGLPSDQLGGSIIRDALSSRYVFNTTTLQARMAGLDNETAKRLLMQLDTAGPGYAILASASRKAEIIAVPNTTIDDLRIFAEGYPGLPPLPPNPSVCVQPDQTPEAPKQAPGSTHTHNLTPEERAYIVAQHGKMSPSAIAVLLWKDAHLNVVVRQVWQEEGL